MSIDRRLSTPVRLVAVLVLAALVAFSPAAWTQTATAGGAVLSGLDQDTRGQTDDKSLALRGWLEAAAAREEVPGAALLVAHQGRVVFREAAGLADAAKLTKLSPDMVFLIASTTKPISATGVMTLVDQGKLSLDDPAAKYLPAFGSLKPAETGGKAPSPTMRQLLSHTSGLFGLIGATKTGMRAVRDFSLSLKQSVDIIAAEKLTSVPGTKFNYGGANFQVCARIAELISGQSFDRFLAERVFEPLGMKSTFFKPAGEQTALKAALPYMWRKGKGLIPIAAYLPDPNRKLVLASGGLYSSLNDLAVFLQMQLNNGEYGDKRILSSKAVATMQTRQTGPAKVPYGLGWFIQRPDASGRGAAVYHPGLFGAVAWLDRDRQLVGVLLTSSLWPGREQLIKDVMAKVKELFPAGS